MVQYIVLWKGQVLHIKVAQTGIHLLLQTTSRWSSVLPYLPRTWVFFKMAVVEKMLKKSIIRDALLLMRDSIKDVSKDYYQKEKGKAVATKADLDFEFQFEDRVKAIDLILDEYIEDTFEAVSIHGKSPQLAQSISIQATSTTSAEESEPYMNPFTGRWVYPAHPDDAGPSDSFLNDQESVEPVDPKVKDAQ